MASDPFGKSSSIWNLTVVSIWQVARKECGPSVVLANQSSVFGDTTILPDLAFQAPALHPVPILWRHPCFTKVFWCLSHHHLGPCLELEAVLICHRDVHEYMVWRRLYHNKCMCAAYMCGSYMWRIVEDDHLGSSENYEDIRISICGVCWVQISRKHLLNRV